MKETRGILLQPRYRLKTVALCSVYILFKYMIQCPYVVSDLAIENQIKEFIQPFQYRIYKKILACMNHFSPFMPPKILRML